MGLVSGGVIPQKLRGTSSNTLIHIADWYATLSVLAGVAPSDNVTVPPGKGPGGYIHPGPYEIDGVDAWPRLMGTNLTNPRPFVPTTEKALLWETQGVMFKYYTSASASFWFTPNNTYVPAPSCDSPGGCLFEVLSDPEERYDIAASKPDIVEKMRSQLANYTPYVNGFQPPPKGNDHYDCNKSVGEAWIPFNGPCCKPKAEFSIV